jgi:hypothetical protein
MIRERSSRQLAFDFALPFEGTLDPNNRWVRLAEEIPWDELATIYHRSLKSTKMGPPALPARVVIGALIIKHIKKLPDEEVIEDIRENPYYQYFLGYSGFANRTVFVPSLFVEIRKRLGKEALQQINELFVSRNQRQESHSRDDADPPSGPSVSSGTKKPTPLKPKGRVVDPDVPRSGMLILDATVAPSDIRYPTDVDLLNQAREQAESLIDRLWTSGPGRIKPRTYRKRARKAYLAFTHNRKPGKKKIRKAVMQQLGYLRRDLGHIDRLLDSHGDSAFPLPIRQQRILWIIRELYRQQQQMADRKSHVIEGRIVSLSQPHVRPIVRGKAGRRTEFGAKISASLIDGQVILDRLSWDAYNESHDLIRAVQDYKRRFGCYPASVNADKIYWNRENRKFVKDYGIALYGGRPLGRPKVEDSLRGEAKRIHCEQSKRRNGIEGKFGEGKRRYGLGLVMAKTRRTSESWIAMVIFVMNLARAWRELFFSLFFGAVWKLNPALAVDSGLERRLTGQKQVLQIGKTRYLMHRV